MHSFRSKCIATRNNIIYALCYLLLLPLPELCACSFLPTKKKELNNHFQFHCISLDYIYHTQSFVLFHFVPFFFLSVALNASNCSFLALSVCLHAIKLNYNVRDTLPICIRNVSFKWSKRGHSTECQVKMWTNAWCIGTHTHTLSSVS